MARTAKVTDFPFKGRGTRSLAGKGKNEPKRTSNLRAVDAHLKNVRTAATKKAPKLSGGGMLHDTGGPHPVAHLSNSGASAGQSASRSKY